MNVNLSPVGGVAAQFFDNNGDPLAGGLIYTYAAGTTTPQATYTSSAGAIAHSNPIVLNAAARVSTGEIWLTDTLSYKFVLKTSDDVLIATYDNIFGINANQLNFAVQEEVQTATAGQTVFHLNTLNYQPGTNNLSVYVNGINKTVNVDYVETNSTTVTFLSGVTLGSTVKFTTAVAQSSGATDAAIVAYTAPETGAVATTVALKLDQMVSVKDFGAIGDGLTDDTAAIQAAFNTGKSVSFPYGTYATSAPLTINTSGVTITGPGTLKPLSTFTGAYLNCAINVTNTNVRIEGITYDGSNTTSANAINFAIYGYAANLQVMNCYFYNMPTGFQPEAAIGVNADGDGSRFIGNYFNNIAGAVFVQASACIISNNTVINPRDGALVLNSTNSVGCIIANNIIRNDALNTLSGHILIEEGASEWLIEGNNIYGVRGTAIYALNVAVTTTVRGGVIRNNVINGGGGTFGGPCTYIIYSEYYTDVSVAGNYMYNMPTGFAGNAFIGASATSGVIENNIMDGASAPSIASLMNIYPGGSHLTIRDNDMTAGGNRHVLFANGDFTSNIISFIGGKFFGGSLGIDCSSAFVVNMVLYVENISQFTGTTFINTNAAMNWGLRQIFLNSGALNYPHSIKARTVMHGTTYPSVAADGAWAGGDTIYSTVFFGGSKPSGWVCSVNGTPGTWYRISDATFPP